MKGVKEHEMHVNKWKKSIWKSYLLYNSYCMTSWQRQNEGVSDNKQTAVAGGGGAVGRQSREDV